VVATMVTTTPTTTRLATTTTTTTTTPTFHEADALPFLSRRLRPPRIKTEVGVGEFRAALCAGVDTSWTLAAWLRSLPQGICVTIVGCVNVSLAGSPGLDPHRGRFAPISANPSPHFATISFDAAFHEGLISFVSLCTGCHAAIRNSFVGPPFGRMYNMVYYMASNSVQFVLGCGGVTQQPISVNTKSQPTEQRTINATWGVCPRGPERPDVEVCLQT
jgi:hypothetical protein